MTTQETSDPAASALHLSSTGGTRIQSVSRAVRILLAIAESDQGLTVKEVATRFSLSPTTCYHLLNTLVDESVVVKDDRRRYLLGPMSALIADGYTRRNIVPERYLRVVSELAARTGETAYLSAWRDGAISVLATFEGSHAVRVAGLTTGYSDHLHARASGKLMLALAPDAVRESVLSSIHLSPMTAHTIVSEQQLRRELADIARDDIAYDRQEFRDGVECVSVPIREAGRVAACVTLSCPAERFHATDGTLVAALRAAALEAAEVQ